VFIPGISRGNIPPKVLYPPTKTFVSGKSQLLVQRKAFSFWEGASPSRPPEQQLCLWTLLGEQPPDSPAVVSIHLCPRCPDTPSFWPCGVKMLCVNVQKASASGGLLLPDPCTAALPLDHTEGLPKFRFPSSPVS